MSDLRIKYDVDSGEFDLGLLNNEFEYDDGLETACLISLFTDARVEKEELPDGETSRRGFWGDASENPDNVPTGSKLWLLDRSKTTDETLEAAREYCLLALQWLVDDGIASSVEVQTSYLDKFTMEIDIQILRPKGSDPVNFKFNFVWEARSNAVR